jgi:hypothetical protein
MLLGNFGGTVGLVAGVGRPEGRVVLQLAVDPQDDGEGPQVHVEPPGVEHLRDETAVGQGDLVADAVFAGAGRQQLLHRPEPPVDPVLRPLVLLLLPHVDQNHEILQGLDARRYHLADLAHLGALDHVGGQERPLGPRLLQVAQDAERFDEGGSVDLQRRHLLHGVDLPELVRVLFTASFDQRDRFDVVGYLFEVERYSDPPRARTAPIRVQNGLETVSQMTHSHMGLERGGGFSLNNAYVPFQSPTFSISLRFRSRIHERSQRPRNCKRRQCLHQPYAASIVLELVYSQTRSFTKRHPFAI